jgi:hypothetical protein
VLNLKRYYSIVPSKQNIMFNSSKTLKKIKGSHKCSTEKKELQPNSRMCSSPHSFAFLLQKVLGVLLFIIKGSMQATLDQYGYHKCNSYIVTVITQHKMYIECRITNLGTCINVINFNMCIMHFFSPSFIKLNKFWIFKIKN